MSEGNYSDLLNTQWDEIPKPKTWPAGSYRLKVSGAPRESSFEDKNGDTWQKLSIFHKHVEPMADVNEDELQGMGDYDFGADVIVREFLYRTKRDLDKVRKALVAYGFAFTDDGKETEGRSMVALLGELKGREIIGYVEPRSYTDRNGQVQETNNLTAVTAVED